MELSQDHWQALEAMEKGLAFVVATGVLGLAMGLWRRKNWIARFAEETAKGEVVWYVGHANPEFGEMEYTQFWPPIEGAIAEAEEERGDQG